MQIQPLPDSKKFYIRFLQLALVNILSNLMVPLAGLADLAFLGHLDAIHHLAGVALATILFNYLYWTFGFLRMGTTGMTAQVLGRGDPDGMVLIGLRHGFVAVGVGLILIVLQYPLQVLGFAILQGEAAVKTAGIAYYEAMIWGAPATLLNFVLLGSLLGQKRGRAVLLLSLVGNGLNVILNYWFIVRWGWESRGAGAGTALSQYGTLMVGMLCLLRPGSFQFLRQLSNRIFDLPALKSAFTFNLDIVIRTLALVTTFSVFTNFSANLGTVYLATNTVLLQVVTLAAYFIDGIAFATESFAGSAWGSTKHQTDPAKQELRQLLRLAGGLSLSWGIAFAIAFNRFPSLFRLLTDHSDILQNVQTVLPWLFPVLGFGAIAYFLDGYFLGLTQGRILRNSTLVAVLGGFLPLALLASLLQNNHLLWFALSCFMLARASTLGWFIPKTLQLTQTVGTPVE